MLKFEFLPTYLFLYEQILNSGQVNIPENNVKAIEREVIWRTISIQGSSLYHEYFDNHVIPQGSEYLYLSGADGGKRYFEL